MILTIAEVMELIPDYAEESELKIQNLLNAVESMVRQYTNNNFQNRHIRFSAANTGNTLHGVSHFLCIGDTVQISESMVNDGLYTVVDKDGESVTVMSYGLGRDTLLDVQHNLVTKVEYPQAVKQGVVNIMTWELTGRDKVGVKSETLSRHSVTYYDQDRNNQCNGYPVSLLGFLDLYMKARF